MWRDFELINCPTSTKNIPQKLIKTSTEVPKDKYGMQEKQRCITFFFSIFYAFLISSAGSLLASKKSKNIYVGKNTWLRFLTDFRFADFRMIRISAFSVFRMSGFLRFRFTYQSAFYLEGFCLRQIRNARAKNIAEDRCVDPNDHNF